MKIIFIIIITFFSTNIFGAEANKEPMPKLKWSFNGITGTFDKAALQRGYKVYTVSTSVIGNNASSIKDYISNAYQNFNPPLESLILRKRSSSPEDWYLEKIPFNSPNDLG